MKVWEFQYVKSFIFIYLVCLCITNKCPAVSIAAALFIQHDVFWLHLSGSFSPLCILRSSNSTSNLKKPHDLALDVGSGRSRTESFNELASDSEVVTLKFNTKVERTINRGCILGKSIMSSNL